MSAALEDKIRRDRKLRLLAVAIADFEAEFGEFTAEEIASQQRIDREAAAVVRGRQRSDSGRPKSA